MASLEENNASLRQVIADSTRSEEDLSRRTTVLPRSPEYSAKFTPGSVLAANRQRASTRWTQIAYTCKSRSGTLRRRNHFRSRSFRPWPNSTGVVLPSPCSKSLSTITQDPRKRSSVSAMYHTTGPLIWRHQVAQRPLIGCFWRACTLSFIVRRSSTCHVKPNPCPVL
jgi:hypothetical protein